MSDKKPSQLGRALVWSAVLLLVVLHHDVWNWDSRTLLFGVIPLTLGYHVGLSLAAAVVWWIAIQIAWPSDLDEEPSSATPTSTGDQS